MQGRQRSQDVHGGIPGCTSNMYVLGEAPWLAGFGIYPDFVVHHLL
jgi:hypothetical protein